MQEAADRPYEQAVDHLDRSHHIRISKQTLERLTESVGSYWLERDEAEYQALEFQAAPVIAGQTAPERCLIYADGVMVHSDGAWHEARVGHVRSERPEDRVDASSTARLCDIPTFERDLWRKARQMGYDQAPVAAFIADGSHWLWNMANRNFEKAVQILDFYHLSQHVHACGDAFYGEQTAQGRQWSVEIRGALRAGQVEAVLERVESLPGRSKLKRQAKHELVTYLSNNRDRMDYPRYEAMGLPIGSGPVEAQCKVLVQARCKQAGMRWKKAGLESLLRVRCAVRDGSYDQKFGHWPIPLTAWTAQRRKAAKPHEPLRKTPL